MTKLECSVRNCMHNSDNYCCKSAILVDGHEAVKPNDTCCASFDENKGGAFTNLFKTPESRLEVECDAVKVFITRDRRCAAEHIDIAGDGACDCGQTRCATFKAR